VGANKRYREILQLAAQEGEAHVDEALRGLLEAGEIAEGKLTVEAVRAVLSQAVSLPPATQICVAEVALASFDELLSASSTMGVMQ